MKFHKNVVIGVYFINLSSECSKNRLRLSVKNFFFLFRVNLPFLKSIM